MEGDKTLYLLYPHPYIFLHISIDINSDLPLQTFIPLDFISWDNPNKDLERTLYLL